MEADVCVFNAGILRIDSIIEEGPLRLKEIFGMLPFIDPIIKIEITGSDLLKVLENGVSQYPALEGRFPMVTSSIFIMNLKFHAVWVRRHLYQGSTIKQRNMSILTEKICHLLR